MSRMRPLARRVSGVAIPQGPAPTALRRLDWTLWFGSRPCSYLLAWVRRKGRRGRGPPFLASPRCTVGSCSAQRLRTRRLRQAISCWLACKYDILNVHCLKVELDTGNNRYNPPQTSSRLRQPEDSRCPSVSGVDPGSSPANAGSNCPRLYWPNS